MERSISAMASLATAAFAGSGRFSAMARACSSASEAASRMVLRSSSNEAAGAPALGLALALGAGGSMSCPSVRAGWAWNCARWKIAGSKRDVRGLGPGFRPWSFHVAVMICFCNCASFTAGLPDSCSPCDSPDSDAEPSPSRNTCSNGRTSPKKMSPLVRRTSPSGPMSSAQRNHPKTSSGLACSSSSRTWWANGCLRIAATLVPSRVSSGSPPARMRPMPNASTPKSSETVPEKLTSSRAEGRMSPRGNARRSSGGRLGGTSSVNGVRTRFVRPSASAKCRSYVAPFVRPRTIAGRLASGWLLETTSRSDAALDERETSTAFVTGLVSCNDNANRDPSTAVTRRVSSTCLGALPV